MIKKEYQVASIEFNDGFLVVDSVYSRRLSKHYNVTIEQIEENLYIVTGDKPFFELYSPYFNIGHDISIDDLKETEYYPKKSWWSGKIKQVINEGYVEFKQTSLRTYTTNKILIKE